MNRVLQFSRDEAGNVMMMFVISLVAIVAMVGATLALSMDSSASSELQYTADSAALGGAVAFVKTDSPKLKERKEVALQQAQALANENSDKVIIGFDAIATSEDEYGQYMTMEVSASFKPTNAAASVMGRNANVEVTSRAVADATRGFPLCVLALAKTGTAFSTDNQALFDSKNCIVWSNSKDDRSFNFPGGAAKAKAMCTAGGVHGGMRAKPSPSSQCRQIKDPLEEWKPPQPGNCPGIGAAFSPSAADLAKQLNAHLKFDFEPVRFLEEHRKLLIVLQHMHNGGWNGNGRFGLQTMAEQVPEIADMEDHLSQYNNRSHYLHWHPYFSLNNKRLDTEGRFTYGAGKGLTMLEIAQILGLFDNADPASYAGDSHVDIPTVEINPGTFCGLDISVGHVKFNPGTYFIKNAPLTVRRKATMSGEGVTIVMSGQNAYFGIMDEARLNLTAPASGALAGFALVEDKAPAYTSNELALSKLSELGRQDRPRSKLTGSGQINAVGTIYLPRHDFAVTGDGAGQQTSPLLQIVANTVQLSDNGQIKIDFDEEKSPVPAGIKAERTARLIE